MKTISELLSQAERIAREGGAERPAAEHLVQAALHLPDGTATRAFERIGASAADFTAALAAQQEDDLARAGVTADADRIDAHLPEPTAPVGIYRSEPSAQELFQAAGENARLTGGALVGAHVLCAAAALQHGPTARAFRRMGIDASDLDAAARSEIEAQART